MGNQWDGQDPAGFQREERKQGARRLKTEGPPLWAAHEARTGDGPLEVTKEGRGLVMRVRSEGVVGRLVVGIFRGGSKKEPSRAFAGR